MSMITVEFEPESREFNVVEWMGNVGSVLFKTNDEDEADELAALYRIVEEHELANTVFCEWDL